MNVDNLNKVPTETIPQAPGSEVIEFAFQVYLIGQLDERLFMFFCLLNDRYQA